MTKALPLILVLFACFALAEDKLKEPKHEEPAEVALTKDQETQLDLITSQFREAVAVEEAAKAKKESAQLKYTLAVTQFRAALKVADDYQFDEASKKFVRKKAAKP